MINNYSIRDTFATEVRKVIPDDLLIVFHGANNIGTVEEIINSGGLFSPKR